MNPTDQELDALLDSAMIELVQAARRVVASPSSFNLSLLQQTTKNWDAAKLKWVEAKRKNWSKA